METKEIEKLELLERVKRIVLIMFNHDLHNTPVTSVKEKISQVLMMPDFKSLSAQECFDYWVDQMME